MTEQVTQAEPAILDLSIDHLQLTLKTARQLRRHGIERIGQLVERASAGLANIGLEREQVIQVKDVLASRGL